MNNNSYIHIFIQYGKGLSTPKWRNYVYYDNKAKFFFIIFSLQVRGPPLGTP